MATALPDDPTKVFGRRVGAAVIDGLIVAVPGLAILSSQYEYIDLPSEDAAVDYCDAFTEQIDGICINLGDQVYFNDEPADATALIGIGLSLLLFVVMQGLLGWTIGKRLTGIRTVAADGGRPGLGRALVRWLLLVVDGQPCGIPLVGFISGLTTVGHRRVGDMVAKTYVVRASAAGAPIVVPGLTAPPGAPTPPEAYAATGATWGSAASGGSPIPPPPAARPGPQWDEARNTYIQWDPDQRLWVQWDDTAKTWNAIPNQ